ncbi:MAG: hypothetical protein JWP72_4142, partial [Massilia sp.]|nr:hypothetical protein [Massilia sp.]
EEIRKKSASNFKNLFECSPDTVKSYQSYMAALPIAGDTVEAQIKSHLRLYYSVNGTMHRQDVKNVGDSRRSENKIKYVFGSKGMAFEIRLHRTLLKAGQWLRLGERNARGFAQYVEIQDWQLAAWDADAAQSAVDFVSRYVHDSKVDFMGNIEPFTYFRPRGVEESSISIWTHGGGWIRNKSESVGNTARSVVDASKERVFTAAEGASAIAKRTADTAQKHAAEASDFAKRKAQEAANASSRAYNRAVASGRQTVAEAAHKADELERDAEKIYENGVRWAYRKIDNIRELSD